jgi:hypothetical protein
MYRSSLTFSALEQEVLLVDNRGDVGNVNTPIRSTRDDEFITIYLSLTSRLEFIDAPGEMREQDKELLQEVVDIVCSSPAVIDARAIGEADADGLIIDELTAGSASGDVHGRGRLNYVSPSTGLYSRRVHRRKLGTTIGQSRHSSCPSFLDRRPW